MKKNLFALALAGTMVLGMNAVAFAEETEAAGSAMELDYSMIDESVYEGAWVTAFGVFDLYLPADWNVLVNVESEEEVENYVYFTAANDDQTESVSISYAPSEFTDITAVAEAYAQVEGFTAVEVGTLNGIEVVSYDAVADGVAAMGVVALGDQGGLYNVTVGCPEEAKDDFMPTAFNILVSFSATEAAE